MSVVDRLSGSNTIKTGAAEKLADSLAAEKARHTNALNGIVDAAETRKGQITQALVQLEQERAALDGVISNAQ